MLFAVQLRRLLDPASQDAMEGHAESDDKPMLLWVRLVPPATQGWGTIEGAVVLIPHREGSVTGNAPRDGAGPRLEVTAPTGIDEMGLSLVHERFAWLADHGVEVEVLRDQRPQAPRPVPARKTEDVPLRVCSPAVAARLAYPARV